MKTLIALLILISTSAFAQSKVVSGSMHGDKMIVHYSVLNSGRHLLSVSEKIRSEGPKAREKTVQSLDLNIKDGETLAPYNGFKCSTKKKEFVYGVVAADTSKKVIFQPVRAWIVDEANVKLIPVQKVSTVDCEWAPEGDDGKIEN